MTGLDPALVSALAAGLAILAVSAAIWAALAERVATREWQSRRLDRYAPPLAGAPGRHRNAEDEVLRHAREITARRRGQGGSSLRVRLDRAGLDWPIWVAAAVVIALGAIVAALAILAGLSPILSGICGVAIGPALFLMVLKFRQSRRKAALERDFPAALDIIVRGVKTGLPLVDCLRIVARELPDPLGAEFAKIIEHQGHGLSIAEATDRFAARVPLSEANFFATVIGLQTRTGGRLSESLDNLVSVLRARVQLRAKIQSMSSEAKASGGIIGALPVIVSALVYVTSPQYMSLLFTETVGNLVLIASALWMIVGTLVMRKMIQFDH